MTSTYEEMIQNDPELKRRYEIISTVGAESERGMAVLVAAELDRALDLLLHAYLAPGKARQELFDGGAPPLGSFSAKINLTRALHLITDEEYASLHLIRRIRNEFAHNPTASFNDPRILAWTKSLPERANERTPKTNFELCAVSLIAHIETNAVRDATGRVFEESFNTFYRRGADSEAQPFASKDEAAAAYQGAKR